MFACLKVGRANLALAYAPFLFGRSAQLIKKLSGLFVLSAIICSVSRATSHYVVI
jgi:hypothetical protein